MGTKKGSKSEIYCFPPHPHPHPTMEVFRASHKGGFLCKHTKGTPKNDSR